MSFFDNSRRFRPDPPSSPGPKTSFNIKASFPGPSPSALIRETSVDSEDLRRRRLASRARAASTSPTVDLYETHFSDALDATAILQATAVGSRSDVDSKVTVLPGPLHYDVTTFKSLAAEAGTKGSSFSPHPPTKCLKTNTATDHLGPGCYGIVESIAKKSHNKSPPSKATLYVNSPSHSPRQGGADKELPSNSSSGRQTPSRNSSDSFSNISAKPKSRKDLKEAFLLVKDMHKHFSVNVESSEEFLYREILGSAPVNEGFLDS